MIRIISPIDLRLAGPDDVQALTEIFLAARDDAMPDLPKLYDEAQTRWWMEHVVIGTLATRTALVEGRIVGFASLRAAHLEHLYVHPGLQGRGIGRRLLDEARADVAELRLRVFQSNVGARRFYERAGFDLEASCDGSDNEEGLPDAVYVWRRSKKPERP